MTAVPATHPTETTRAERVVPVDDASACAGTRERGLIARAKRGDADAFGRLVAEHEGAVMTAIRFRLPRELDAEDVAQEAFLRAWSAIDSFEEGRPFRPWVMTIAIRAAISAGRRRGAEHRATTVLRNRQDGVGVQPDRPRLSPRDQVWRVAQEELPAGHATALWLRYGEDMSIAGIAKALGRTEIAVRVLLSRARSRLARALDDADLEETVDRGPDSNNDDGGR